MCVAAPGKILSINGTTATVAYSGNRVPANLGVVKAQVGDWVLVHAGLVILAAYYVENRWFTVTPFHPKTLLLFLVFQLASINLVTFVAYGVDKRAAQKGDWRVPESNLHTLEFLGGWAGDLLGQKFFHHKSKKRSYQTFFWMMMLFEAALVFVILRFLHII